MDVSSAFPSSTTVPSVAANKKLNLTQLCRICASSNEYLIPIFEGEGVQLELSIKVDKYLPVKITSTDALPTSMCYQCASSILSWHDLVVNCVEADKHLRSVKVNSSSEFWEEDKFHMSTTSNSEIITTKEANSTHSKESLMAPQTPHVSSASSEDFTKLSESSADKKLNKNERNIFTELSSSHEPSSKETCSEKFTKSVENMDYDSIENSAKMKNDPELMDSMIPEITLEEGGGDETVLPRKKRSITYYSDDEFEYGIFDCDDNNTDDEDYEPLEGRSRKQRKSKKPKASRAAFKCEFCSASYSRSRDVARHQRNKHSEKLAMLPIGSVSKKSDESSSELSEDVITCSVCNFECKSKPEILKHLQDEHDDLFKFDDIETDDKSRTKKYFCNLCSTFIKGRKVYLAHHKSEHPGMKHDYIRETPKQCFYCDFCSVGFTRNHDLLRHQQKKHPECIIVLNKKFVLRRRIICSLCEEEFNCNDDIHRHLKKKHNVGESKMETNMLLACYLCENTFHSEIDFIEHGNALHVSLSSSAEDKMFVNSDQGSKSSTNNDTIVTCDICGLTFKQRYRLMSHKSKHITLEDQIKYEANVESCKVLINNEPNYRCDRCSRMFAKEELFIRHLILHDTRRTFCCHICGFQCLTQAHLKRHMNVVHLKKRDFKCDICGHAFAEKQAMADHRRTHTGERPFQCKICGKMFPSWTCVYTHKRSHTDYFPYPCTETGCISKFRTKYRLKEHMRRHTGERPFSCPIASCTKTFHDKRAISRHLTVHSSLRPCICPHCGRTYKHQKYLSYHLKTNHGIRAVSSNNNNIDPHNLSDVIN